MNSVFSTSHGNTLTVEYIYPNDNPEAYIADITDVLTYIGIFQNIGQIDKGALIEI